MLEIKDEDVRGDYYRTFRLPNNADTLQVKIFNRWMT